MVVGGLVLNGAIGKIAMRSNLFRVGGRTTDGVIKNCANTSFVNGSECSSERQRQWKLSESSVCPRPKLH